MRDAFVRSLMREMEQDPRIVLITGDLGFGVLRPVKERYPDRLINAGIAEQSMVGLAAGLAATGRTAVVYSIGNFPTLRPLEQIRNDCAYHEMNVKIVCVGGGFVYGSLGMSHHATEDMAVLRAIPGVTCFTPGDPAETEAVTQVMFATPGTCYLRLGRGNEPHVHETEITGWTFPKAICVREGRDIALLSAGGILIELKKAAEKLEREKIDAAVWSFPCLKPIDRETILAALPKLEGTITQIPSAFSAIKQNGRPLYDMARRGEAVEAARLVLMRRSSKAGAATATATRNSTHVVVVLLLHLCRRGHPAL